MATALGKNFSKKIGFRLPDSIFIRCLAVLAISTVLTIGLVTYKSSVNTGNVASKSLMKLGGEVTRQLGARVGPALRFRKADDINDILTAVIEDMDGSASGAVVLAADGSVVAERLSFDYDTSPLLEAARSSLSEGAFATNEERLIVAQPIRHGEDQAIIGVVALDWRTDVLYTVVKRQNQTSLAIAAVLTVLMLAFCGLMIKRMVANPLKKVATAMKEVENGNYDAEVPKLRRGNEIGMVVRALDEFKQRLASTEATRRDAAMKSAALDAGSAAIMIADADFTIVYASKATMKILEANSEVIKSRIPSFDHENIIGQTIDIFHKKPDMQRSMLTRLGSEGHSAVLEMDEVSLDLRISKIDNEDGERVGYVVEWDDATERRLNSAVLSSLDANQARAEFNPTGELVDANDAFLKLVGLETVNKSFLFDQSVFKNEAAADPSQPDFAEFRVKGTDGTCSYVLGGVSPVFFNNGSLKRTVLIGADVTEERVQSMQASEERERRQNEQKAMVQALSGALDSLAQGDLAVQINEPFAGENDRIRKDFNFAVSHLREAIEAVEASATTIRSEVEGVASASSVLAKRTESQAATLEETAAAVSEISASVSNSAQGARSANKVVQEAKDNARSSEEVVSSAVDAMGKIADSSGQITSIVKVIDDIAFQTNLLALNAGVEAARAGDAGRGFAVVASEVRSLAQRSSDAASEISALISRSSENVDLGVELVGNAGKALEDIIRSVSTISDYVSQIDRASQEQSSSIEEINAAMNQLDGVTQENAAMFEETTAASQNLQNAANDLFVRVGQFSTGSGKVASNNDVDASELNFEQTSSETRIA